MKWLEGCGVGWEGLGMVGIWRGENLGRQPSNWSFKSKEAHRMIEAWLCDKHEREMGSSLMAFLHLFHSQEA